MAYQLELDDDIRQLPYVYHGPVIKAGWMPMPIRFAGRPLPQWAVLILAFPFMWPLSSFIVDDLLGLGDLVGWPIKVALAWYAASKIADRIYNRYINSDQSAYYLATYVGREFWRWFRARGPIDFRVTLAAVIPLLSLAALADKLIPFPLPRILWMAAMYVPARFIGRKVVAAWERPERAVERLAARRARSTTAAQQPLVIHVQ